jgi:phage terminase small subunit
LPKKDNSKLSFRQQRFRDEYLLDFNITQAYRRAGYKVKNDNCAAVSGKKLFETPKMQKAIQEKMKEKQEKLGKSFEITEDKVIKEIACIAFSDITNYLKVEDIVIGKSEDGKKELTEQIVKLFPTDDMSKEITSAISEIKQTKTGISLKLHGKVEALTLLCKHLGLLTDKLDLTEKFEINHILNLTPEDLKKLPNERLKQLGEIVRELKTTKTE